MIIACIICAVICGFLYQIWFCKQPSSPTKSCVKTLAIAALALAALLIGAPALLVAGLAFCALGDFWLSRNGERAFLIGLISFAIGHIFYIFLFFNTAAAPLFLLEMPWVIGVGALMMAGGFMGRVLWPATGALRIPVMVYIAIIITMGIAAISTTQNGTNVVLIGAGMFIVSDIILSAELFLLPEKHKLRRVTPQFVWTFYWFGQVAIFSGIVFSRLCTTRFAFSLSEIRVKDIW